MFWENQFTQEDNRRVEYYHRSRRYREGFWRKGQEETLFEAVPVRKDEELDQQLAGG
jgi:hypothetical protein